jgi:hypothetical protein
MTARRRDSRGYTMPKNGWTCYHCGETFTTWGSAEDHFGATPAAAAACKIKVGDEFGLVMELRKAEADRDEWKARALASEDQEESLQGQVSEFERIAGGGVHELRCKLDSMEGRVFTANALIEGFREKDPLKFAEVIG